MPHPESCLGSAGAGSGGAGLHAFEAVRTPGVIVVKGVQVATGQFRRWPEQPRGRKSAAIAVYHGRVHTSHKR